jgi:threonine dehydratase
MLALGAKVVRSDFEGYDDTEEVARAAAARSGRPFLTAFDDVHILAANGATLAAEVPGVLVRADVQSAQGVHGLHVQ